VGKPALESILIQLGQLLRQFFIFAGAKGLQALLFVFLGALVESVGLVLLIPFFSVIIDSQSAGSWVRSISEWLFSLISAESRIARLSLLVALFTVLMIARAVIITVRDVTIAQLKIGFVQEIRSRITRGLAGAQWDMVSRLRQSRITHLMSADVEQLKTVTDIVLRDGVAAVMLVSQIALAFLLAPGLTALGLSVVLLGVTTLLPALRRARQHGRFVTDANLSLIDDATQFLGALKLAISQNLQKSFIRQFQTTLNELGTQQVRYIREQTITGLTVSTLSGVIGAIAMLLGIAVFDISASVLLTLLLIVSRMTAPAIQLQLDAQNFARGLPAYETIRELELDLAAAEAPSATASAPAILLSNGRIVFSRVSFVHGGVESVPSGVRNLDLIIEPGSIVGVTGPSGAGKTTFADLLVGLYEPQSGQIRVGGIELRGAAVAAWRNGGGYVSQDPFLFHDTIRRNFLWANPKAGEAALWDVLRMAGAEELVRDAPQGLNTVVGERGSLMSGGERQRLCLARAMLRRPRLLVLDEATSAIDIDSEYAIFKRLLGTIPRPTIVMIAHRPESLQHCSRVLQLEGGTLVSDSSDNVISAARFQTLSASRDLIESGRLRERRSADART
jgi:ATP-binding cassette subfamily C protein